ncbi:MAG: hypothetical protein M3N11_02960, partial [Actinomycetota bacterium]|nr:hypothetical protein [Actinomycetota bacterium]
MAYEQFGNAPGSVSATGPAPDARSRFRGALLGVVVGDALGAPFEGHPGPVPAGHLAGVEED